MTTVPKLIAILIIFLLGCSKATDPSVENVSADQNPAKIKTEIINGYNADYETKKEWSYDDQGRETGMASYEDGILQGNLMNYQYDEMGRVIYYQSVMPNESICCERSMTYNPYGNLLSDEGCAGHAYWTYNDRGVEIGFHSASIEKKNYRYDKNQNITYYNAYAHGNLHHTMSCTFDDSGNKIVETRVYGDGTSRYEWKYDENGLLSSYTIFVNGNFHEITKNYRHDHLGNMTYCETFDNTDRLIKKVTRTYQYFDV